MKTLVARHRTSNLDAATAEQDIIVVAAAVASPIVVGDTASSQLTIADPGLQGIGENLGYAIISVGNEE